MFLTEVDFSHMLLVSVILTVDKVIFLKIILYLQHHYVIISCFIFETLSRIAQPALWPSPLHLSGAWITGTHHHPLLSMVVSNGFHFRDCKYPALSLPLLRSGHWVVSVLPGGLWRFPFFPSVQSLDTYPYGFSGQYWSVLLKLF